MTRGRVLLESCVRDVDVVALVEPGLDDEDGESLGGELERYESDLETLVRKAELTLLPTTSPVNLQACVSRGGPTSVLHSPSANDHLPTHPIRTNPEASGSGTYIVERFGSRRRGCTGDRGRSGWSQHRGQ